jgi:hypothetical protein
MDVANLDAIIDELQTLDLDSLRTPWRTQFERSAPQNLSKKLLFHLLTYKIQIDAYDDLRAQTVQFLNAVAKDKAVPAPGISQSNGGLKPGTVLVREHAGSNHRVVVTDDGGMDGGRDRDRTCDPLHVKEVLSR